MSDDPTTYTRFTYQSFKGGDPTTTNLSKRFDVSGDHLHVLDISGADNVAVRLGDSVASWIPVRKGMTLKRRFTKVTVGIINGQNIQGHPGRQLFPTIADFVASYGELVVSPGYDDSTRFQAGFWSYRDALATTTPRQLFADLISSTMDRYELGRKGCTLFVRNVDLVNTLYIFYEYDNNGFPASNGWRIYPGETIIMQWGDRMLRLLKRVNDTTVIDGLQIVTLSGTARYDWMVSRNPTAFPFQQGEPGVTDQ